MSPILHTERPWFLGPRKGETARVYSCYQINWGPPQSFFHSPECGRDPSEGLSHDSPGKHRMHLAYLGLGVC